MSHTLQMFGDLGRTRSAKKLAAELGLEFDTDTSRPPDFHLLRYGSRAKVKRTLQRPDGSVRVFDFQTETPNGRVGTISGDDDGPGSEVTERSTGVVVAVPLSAPHTILSRRTLTAKFTDKVGNRDGFVTGHAVFDSGYEAKTLDEEFARLLLDDATIDGLLTANDVLPKAAFEFRDQGLLVLARRRSMSTVRAILEWSDHFRSTLDPQLAERYPAPS